MMRRVAIFAIAVSMATMGSAVAQDQTNEAAKLKPGEESAPKSVRTDLINARSAIAAEKKAYKVGLNPASLKPRSQLMGELPDPLTSEQKFTANRKAGDLLNLEKAAREEYNKGRGVSESALKPRKVCDAKMKRFDWRDPKKVTPIRNQKSCGACWAFSAWGAYESSYLIVNRRSVDGSEQDLIDCAVDNNGNDAGSCEGGLSWMAFEYMAHAGAINEVASKYKAAQFACKTAGKRPIRTIAWGFVNPAVDLPSVDELKTAMCDHGALSVSMRVVSNDFINYERGVYDEVVTSPTEGGGHAVTLVGWDDTKDNGKGKKGAWLVKNSWGEQWGEIGYAWMTYGSNLIGRNARWVQAFEDKLLPAWNKVAPKVPASTAPAADAATSALRPTSAPAAAPTGDAAAPH